MISEVNRYQTAKSSGTIDQFYSGSLEKAKEEAALRQLAWVEELEEKLKVFIGKNKKAGETVDIKNIPLK